MLTTLCSQSNTIGDVEAKSLTQFLTNNRVSFDLYSSISYDFLI